MRTVTTRSSAWALVALLAVVSSACGGSDDAAVDADATTTSAVAPTTATGGEEAPSTTAAGTAATVDAGSPTTRRAGGTASSGTKSGGTATAAGPPKPTQPGTYTYATTGKRSSPAFGEQPVDGQELLKVDAASGRDQKTTQSSDDGSTEQVLRFGDDGIRLVSTRIANRAATKEFKPGSPVLVLPHPLADGQSWAWKMTSTDGGMTVDATFRFVRRESITVGGEAVATNVIEATITTSGDIVSTSHQTIWTSPALRLIVQQKDVTDGSFGQVQFHSDTMRKLRSTKPS